jgi:hypothetical protein
MPRRKRGLKIDLPLKDVQEDERCYICKRNSETDPKHPCFGCLKPKNIQKLPTGIITFECCCGKRVEVH